MTNRKMIYAGVYVCVAFAFPALPVGGLEFVGGMFSGLFVSVKEFAGERIREFLLSWLI